MGVALQTDSTFRDAECPCCGLWEATALNEERLGHGQDHVRTICHILITM